jgi:methylated-DNA-[protein]-cysteine S-methyltransferase
MTKLLLNEYDVIIPAPFGAVAVNEQRGQLEVAFLQHFAPLKVQASQPALGIAQQIQAYLDNPNHTFSLPEIAVGTAFQRKVWNAIYTIPVGKTKTYAELALMVGSGPRAVANACGANPLPLLIPCHRVVAKSGLGGFMPGTLGGLEIKRWLLKHEGCHEYQH